MNSDDYFKVDDSTKNKIKKIEGPIIIFGAGGFIGVNLLKTLLLYRNDVYGVSTNPSKNWRFLANEIPFRKLIQADVTELVQVKQVLRKIKPKTIFNLAAYGAYSKQLEYKKIYLTNFTAAVEIIELARENNFSAYIQAGSSSEYGLNAKAPKETSELIPNSHYAVSKSAVSLAIKYFGKIESLPVIDLRLYSAYGPWEEPDRLIPTLCASVRNGNFPPLVDPEISRDFIYIDDIISAFISGAASIKPRLYGEVFNVGTGVKTNIKSLCAIVKEISGLKKDPKFGSMKNRKWDLKDWFADIEKIQRELDWKPTTTLKKGLEKSLNWQNNVNYDTAYWNWTKLQ